MEESVRSESPPASHNDVSQDKSVSVLDFLDKAGESSSDESEHEDIPKIAPAWNDPDDEDVGVDITSRPILKKLKRTHDESVISGNEFSSRLRAQFQKVHRNVPRWSLLPEQKELDPEEEEEIDISVIHDAKSYASASHKGQGLPVNRLSVARCRDANGVEPNQAVVQSVKFNPTVPMLLTAGLDKSLRLFQIDGTRNPKLDSIYFTDMPIMSAAFSSDGEEIICSGRRKFYYSVDVAKGTYEKVHGILGREEKSLESFVLSPDGKTIAFVGNDGYILLVNRKTKLLRSTLRMNGSVRALSFSEDSKYLYSSGGEGRVYLWDMRSERCIDSKLDEGSLSTTSISVSSKNNLFATGSDSGIVNVYNESSWKTSDDTLKPIKVVTNLVTPVDTLLFNSTGEMLVCGSRMKKDSMRVLHTRNNKVFPNWPTSKTPLHYVHCADFSPESGYFSIGNDRGKALLYRLNHFESY